MTLEQRNEILSNQIIELKQENAELLDKINTLELKCQSLEDNEDKERQAAREAIKNAEASKIKFEEALANVQRLEEDYLKIMRMIKSSQAQYNKRMKTFVSQMDKTEKIVNFQETKAQKRINKSNKRKK